MRRFLAIRADEIAQELPARVEETYLENSGLTDSTGAGGGFLLSRGVSAIFALAKLKPPKGETAPCDFGVAPP